MKIRHHLMVALVIAAAIVGVFAPAARASQDGPGPHHTQLPVFGGLAGTSETFTDVRADGSYFDPSLGRRVSLAGGEFAPSAVERLLSQERARGADLCGGLQACIRELAPRQPASSVTIVEPSAFDWGDAGVGAAGVFGLMVLAGGVAIVSRQARSVQGR